VPQPAPQLAALPTRSHAIGNRDDQPEPRPKPGPEPERLKIEGDWEDAVERALKPPKPGECEDRPPKPGEKPKG